MSPGLAFIVAANVRRIRRELLSSAELAAPVLDGVVAHLAAIERGAGALSLRPVEDFGMARRPEPGGRWRSLFLTPVAVVGERV